MFFDYAILHQKSLVLDYDVVPLTNPSYLRSPQHNFLADPIIHMQDRYAFVIN